MLLLNFILFLIVTFLLLYPIGNLLLTLTKFDLSSKQKTLASIPIGVVSFILINYVFAYLQLPFIALLIFGLIICYGFFYKREIFKVDFHDFDKLSLIIIILGTIAFTSLTFYSSLITKTGTNFIGVNHVDGFVHLALMKSEAKGIPAQLPSLNGNILRGYHYFYDFFGSRFILFFNLTAEDLQFRFLPIFMGLFYGLSIYLFLDEKNVIVKRLALFFVYFGQGFTFLWFFFSKTPNLFYTADIPQSIQLIQDPSVVLSLSIFFIAFFLLTKIKNIKQAILIGCALGILAEIKVYAGIIGILVVCSYCFIKFILEKKNLFYYIFTLFITALITAITFLPNNLGTVKLIFAPFLIYNQFISQTPFEFIKWQLLLQVYTQYHNIPRIIQLYLEAFLLFWVEALGLRVLVLLGIFKIFTKNFWRDDIKLILSFSIFFSILIPSLFIQNVSVFDILQFTWVSLVFFGILAAFVFNYLLSKLNRIFKIILIILIIICSIPGLLNVEDGIFINPSNMYFTSSDLKVIQTIKDNTSPYGFLVDIPHGDIENKTFFDRTDLILERGPLVSGLTGRNTYYEKAILKYGFLQPIYSKRKGDLTELANDLLNCNNNAIENKLKQIGSFDVTSYEYFNCANNNPYILKLAKGNNLFYYKFKTIE